MDSLLVNLTGSFYFTVVFLLEVVKTNVVLAKDLLVLGLQFAELNVLLID